MRHVFLTLAMLVLVFFIVEIRYKIFIYILYLISIKKKNNRQRCKVWIKNAYGNYV